MAENYIWIVTSESVRDAVPDGDRGGTTARNPFDQPMPPSLSGDRLVFPFQSRS
ncbi:MAG: hypothetical protein HC899_31640 [Leptolyngbyaceae cyanobacterium SM1_4_3]|nr:hypothetical protein [Leptolyngbyaceae cyanobacterium SM1_4_3]